MFWPYAIKMSCDRLNTLSLDGEGVSPEERFYGIKRRLDIKDFHTPFCPVYVLHEKLQGRGKSIPKWEPRGRMGIYFGRSPHHARNVALVYNPNTGYVSPQFHVVFDDTFSIVQYMREGIVPPNWRDLCEQSIFIETDESLAAEEPIQPITWDSSNAEEMIRQRKRLCQPYWIRLMWVLREISHRTPFIFLRKIGVIWKLEM